MVIKWFTACQEGTQTQGSLSDTFDDATGRCRDKEEVLRPDGLPLANVPFGKAMKEAHFSFAASYVPLNHGSFGAFPDHVRKYQLLVQTETEARPDTFIRSTYPGLLLQARRAVAPLLGADTEEVVFVPNALTGINTVLRNLTYAEGDVILYFDTIYGGCLKTIQSLEETTPVRAYSIDLVYPVEDADIIRKVEDALYTLGQQGKRVALAMFDTVLTFPGVRFPWELLVQLYREKGIMTCIDAAHGIGHIDLTHLARAGPDFVISNCYKWLFVPRGCTVLYVPKRNQHLIKTSYPTHGRYLSEADRRNMSPSQYFGSLFEQVSTIDTSPYLCVLEALRFRDEVCGGEAQIRSFCTSLAKLGGELMAYLMGTEVLQTKGGTSQECCFTNVKLPLDVVQSSDEGGVGVGPGWNTGILPEEADAVAYWITERSVRELDSYIAVRYYAGGFWTRISGQIYLERADFAWAAGALIELCGRAQRGDWKVGADTASVSWSDYR
ncbi:aminotransferase family protein-like protein [Poronia punctata]|nr:aminotransferase family protein-like protein [Poronia punctata]